LKLIVSQRERLNQRLMFFYFGFGLMALGTRLPELEKNLHVNNGTFGVLMSLGAIGGVIAFLFVGQLVHRVGVGPVIIVSIVMMYGLMAFIPHLHRPWIFGLVNILLGGFWNAYNIAIHDQALKRQLLSGENALPQLHGAWSAGTLLTTVLAIIITAHTTLAWHIDGLLVPFFILTMFSLSRLRPFLIKGSIDHEDELSVKISDILSMLTHDRLIGLAYVCGVMVEFSTNDWVTLSSHQEIKASTTLSIVPYLAFLSAMVVGRLGIHKVLRIKPEAFWIRLGSSVGGSSFIIFLLLAKFVAPHSFDWAFGLEIAGFAIAGLGGSFMAGVITQIASERSTFPAGVVVAQLGLAIAVITMIIKWIVSFVAQATCITYGLMIPGIMMVALSQFKSLGSRDLRV